MENLIDKDVGGRMTKDESIQKCEQGCEDTLEDLVAFLKELKGERENQSEPYKEESDDRQMTGSEAIAIIRKEYLCVNRDCDIERSCGNCDLVMPSKEPILEAYKLAIKSLEAWDKLEKCIPQMASYTSDDGQDLVMAYDVLEFISREVKNDSRTKGKYMYSSDGYSECSK